MKPRLAGLTSRGKYLQLDPVQRPKRRYEIVYYFHANGVTRPSARGFTNSIREAFGHAARHVSRSEMGNDYGRALVVDRQTGKILRVYSRTKFGISINIFHGPSA